MYDKTDLDAAVRSAVISSYDAERLRRFTAARQGASAADEEEMHLVGGFADFMAAVATLFTVSGLAVLSNFSWLAVPVMGALAWCAAEYLIRRRRLQLTGALLFVIFAVGCACLFLLVTTTLPDAPRFSPGPWAGRGTMPPLAGIVAAGGTAMGCVGFWFRFRLPLAYAGAVMAGINLGLHMLRLIAPGAPAPIVSMVLFVSGLIVFALAMRWDMSDVHRQTRRADVAFWLHMLAGYQLAGVSFRLLTGLAHRPTGWDRLYDLQVAAVSGTSAWEVLLLFGVFVVLALAVDRRSILFSSLAFVLPAATRMAGANIGLAMVLIGLVLLALAVGWARLRAGILDALPVLLRAQLPRARIEQVGPRPVR